jgi:adenosylcobinamide-GDP ribazoletransferase
MRLLLVALQFLTIIPLPGKICYEEGDLGRSTLFFPLVGLLLGLMLAGADYFLTSLPPQLSALLLVALLALVTGALHLDGVADVSDGMAARGDRERFLAVMKDSRIGAIGVVGLLLVILLKWQAIAALSSGERRNALIFFPLAARLAQVVIMAGSRAARSDGLGRLFLSGVGWWQLLLAEAFALGIAWFLLGVAGVLGLAVVHIVALGLKWYFHRRLGGITGDIIGCGSEVAEVATLLLLLLVRP